jgi:hypothetical protein
MAIKHRPPLHVEKRQLFGPKGPKFNVWKCDARLQVAKLQYRRNPHLTAVVHRSTKTPGGWQLTYFDDGTPTGDIQVRSCQEAVREVPPGTWRLRQLRPMR